MGRSNEKNVSAAVFVETVNRVHADGGSLGDVAEELGIKVGSVSTRLSGLRKKFEEAGIEANVPEFTRGGGGGANKLDLQELAGIFNGKHPDTAATAEDVAAS